MSRTVTLFFIDGSHCTLTVPDNHPLGEFHSWHVHASSTPAEPMSITPEEVDADLVRQVMHAASTPEPAPIEPATDPVKLLDRVLGWFGRTGAACEPEDHELVTAIQKYLEENR